MYTHGHTKRHPHNHTQTHRCTQTEEENANSHVYILCMSCICVYVYMPMSICLYVCISYMYVCACLKERGEVGKIFSLPCKSTFHVSYLSRTSSWHPLRLGCHDLNNRDPCCHPKVKPSLRTSGVSERQSPVLSSPYIALRRSVYTLARSE